MLKHPQFDPIAFSVGPVDIHWYGISYLATFGICWYLLLRATDRADFPLTRENVSDLIFYGAVGTVVGGRCGYVFLYAMPRFLEDPLYLFYVKEGGMSFHGGLIGVIVGMMLFARKIQQPFFVITDRVAVVVPLGLGLGRLANFVNGELWGRVTDVPWGMVFAGAGSAPRHPSQLYQFFLEGLVLFAILYWYGRKPRPMMALSGLFLVFYGLFRFAVEFVREPDDHLGFIAFDWLTMGQLLTVPMIVLGGVFFIMSKRQKGATQ
ncbi:MAG: prolipoprotein diacylglyceryl transferase [Pseudomonadota bacterium]